MKPSVHLIKGLHITAADKRNIIAAIIFLQEKFSALVQADPRIVPNYGDIAVRRSGRLSPMPLPPALVPLAPMTWLSARNTKMISGMSALPNLL